MHRLNLSWAIWRGDTQRGFHSVYPRLLSSTQLGAAENTPNFIRDLNNTDAKIAMTISMPKCPWGKQVSAEPGALQDLTVFFSPTSRLSRKTKLVHSRSRHHCVLLSFLYLFILIIILLLRLLSSYVRVHLTFTWIQIRRVGCDNDWDGWDTVSKLFNSSP